MRVDELVMILANFPASTEVYIPGDEGYTVLTHIDTLFAKEEDVEEDNSIEHWEYEKTDKYDTEVLALDTH